MIGAGHYERTNWHTKKRCNTVATAAREADPVIFKLRTGAFSPPRRVDKACMR